MWWLLRGAQSAAFYYISCAPCHEYVYKRKRKKEAVRARQGKHTVETEQPGLFRQPSPFSTNIYWREELALGPGPPPKRGGKDHQGGSQRGLKTGGAGSSLGSSMSASHGSSLSPTETHLSTHPSLSDESWNRKRYQREDECLWGSDPNHVSGYQSGMGGATNSSARRSRSSTATSGNRYQARNPPLNDYHPPVVSTQLADKSETKWMLQPPPSAKIMSGKEKATRSRSDSGGSSRKGVDINLGKRVGERLMEEKVKRGEAPPGFELSSPSRSGSKGKQRAVEDRDLSGENPYDMDPKIPALPYPAEVHGGRPKPAFNSISEDARSDIRNMQRKAPSQESLVETAIGTTPDPPHTPPKFNLKGSGQGSDESLNSEITQSYPLTSHPNSSRCTPPTLSSPSLAKRLTPRLISKESSNSLHVLQELVAPNAVLNSRSNSPIPEAKIKLPPSDSTENEELQLPEVESWFPGDFRFPNPKAGERTKVTSRWSMDI